MTYLTETFPDQIQYNTSGGPQYSIDIVPTASGHEQRNANWSQSLHRYVVNNVRKQADMETIIDFWHAAQAQLHTFGFKDWADYKSTTVAAAITDTDQTLSPVGDGIETDFQLIKTYTKGGLSTVRTITRPVTGTVVVSIDDVSQPTGWTVDTATGIITFSSAPLTSEVVKAGFEFVVPCRFDTAQLSLSHLTCDISSVGLPIIEVRE